MQETSGSLITDTVDSNNGALSGSYTLNQPPGGIACNNTAGSGCSITTAVNYTSPQPMSLYVDFVGTSGGILQLGTSSSLSAVPYYVLFLDNHGKLTFGINNFSTTSIIQSPLPYADGNEHKVLISLGAAGAQMYVDGSLVASSGLTLASYANGFWFFGGVNAAGWPLSPTQAQLNGTLITVAWWNGVQLGPHASTQVTGGLPTAISNNYCTFTNQIASLNPATAQAFANKKLTFSSINQLQVPGLGSSLPIGPNTSIVCQTDASGNIIPGCQIPQGAHVNLSVGTAPPISMVIPASTSCDLTSIVLSQSDPPEVVSAVAVAGPLFAGAIVTNPPPGTIGTATITSPATYSQTQSTTANVDVNLNGNNQRVILTGNATVNLVDFQNGSVFIVDTQENSGGGFSPVFTVPVGWTLTWPGGVATQPGTPSLTANSDNLWLFNATSATTIAGVPLISTSGFPLYATANFNNYSGINVAGLELVKQPPPTMSVTGVCSGTCATAYDYEVTCLTDIGEANPSAMVPATNAASLSTSNYNLVTWAAQPACRDGFNVYGRHSGSLAYLATVGPTANGTNQPSGGGTACAPAYCYVDAGQGPPADVWTIPFTTANGYPAVTILSLSGWNNTVATPIDTSSPYSGISAGPLAAGITTSENNETQVVGIGIESMAGTLTPPGGFSSTVSIPGAPGSNLGQWIGAKNIASAGATGTALGATTRSGSWGTVNLAVLPANTGTPITVTGTEQVIGTGPNFTTVTFGDPVGSSAGNLLIICMSYAAGSSPIVPYRMNLIATGAIGAEGQTNESCYWAVAFGTPAPQSYNGSGSLVQFTPTGDTYHEFYLGLQNWDASNDSLSPNGTTVAATNFIAPMKITGCYVVWHGYNCSTTYPTWAMEDATTSTVLCAATVSGSDTSKGVAPITNTLPGGDQLALLASGAGSGCSAGAVHMSIQMHQ